MFESKYFDAVDEDNPLLNIVFDYIHNLLVGTHLKRFDKKATRRKLGTDAEVLLIKAITTQYPDIKIDEEDYTSAQLVKAARSYLSQAGTKPRVPKELPKSVLHNNIDLFCQLNEMNDIERKIFTFLVVLEDSNEFQDFLEVFGYPITLQSASHYIGVATNTNQEQVIRAV